MGVRCFGQGCLVGESSVCGDRLVAWRFQPYEHAGLEVYNLQVLRRDMIIYTCSMILYVDPIVSPVSYLYGLPVA